MADRRRRRKRASQDSEEEDESGSGTESAASGPAVVKPRAREPEPPVVPCVRVRAKSDEESECESEDGIGDAILSDYESADPEENGSHSEGEEEVAFTDEEASKPPAEPKPSEPEPAVKVEVEAEVEVEVEDEVEAEDEVDEADEVEGEGRSKEVKSEEKGDLAGERQSGDGQESTDDTENKSGSNTGKKLDDDEDRKNPAYIPRKGLFFEHDVRGQAQDDDIRPKGRHRKLWKDEGRWVHDKFREDEQAPKSRDELIAMYGYDIRNANGPSDSRGSRSRKPRYGSPPGRDRRWRDGEKPSRSSWHGGVNNTPPAVSTQPVAPASSGPAVRSHVSSRNSAGGSGRVAPPPQPRSFQNSRPPASYREGRTNYKLADDGSHHHYGGGGYRGVYPESERGHGRRGGGSFDSERGPSVVVEDVHSEEEERGGGGSYHGKPDRDSAPPRREEVTAVPPAAAAPETVFTRDASPAAPAVPERTVEKKSYSLARRTRSRAPELSKQASLEEPAATQPPPQPPPGSSPAGGDRGQSGPATPTAQKQLPPPHGPVKTESWEPPVESSNLDQDLARLSLAGQGWAHSPPTYLPGEMRGISNPLHIAGAPPQYSRIEEMGVGGGRAKRYSSQRQRPVPEPAPMHIGIMEGHYYDPMSFQGPIYAHSESSAPLPPQGMLVQPEMHITHPGLHPHQSGAPLPNPALYPGPPVSISPGQPPPQQLLAPAFYPPPGVMTFGNTNFPYPASATLPPLYTNPQAQSQVYGGVTYYDTMQQQAQPKPSPPRRSSQPVTIKPPPPEVLIIVPQ
ncbi:protein CASC3 isoform X2 [Amia ocellicauda]|uniref:protein CASC3 isoform X2 n=1 Tax=Amia ocellicauda TaxID=2972642 RepID=UPI00346498CC